MGMEYGVRGMGG